MDLEQVLDQLGYYDLEKVLNEDDKIFALVDHFDNVITQLYQYKFDFTDKILKLRKSTTQSDQQQSEDELNIVYRTVNNYIYFLAELETLMNQYNEIFEELAKREVIDIPGRLDILKRMNRDIDLVITEAQSYKRKLEELWGQLVKLSQELDDIQDLSSDPQTVKLKEKYSKISGEIEDYAFTIEEFIKGRG